MAQTLYRKYRPQTFADIIGQNHVKVTLLNELATGRVAHAYLFTGPRGVGKTTIARLLAKAVNCLHPAKDGSPDDTCDACAEIRDGRSLDMIEIDAASHTGVENVRTQIIENARFTPSRWKMKVFIIDEVHMLSASAFNALLKTLEEPPSHVLFILATTEAHKVPETIISRCQRFDFRRLRHEDLMQRLLLLAEQEHVTVAPEVLAAIARYARGSFRDAESLLGQVLTLGDKEITLEQAELVLPRSSEQRALELFDTIVRRDATSAITMVNELVRDAFDIPQFTAELVEIVRKALLVKVNSQLAMFSSLELPSDKEVQLLNLIGQVSVGDLEEILRTLTMRDDTGGEYDLPQLPLELAMLRLTIGKNPAVPPASGSATITQAPVAALQDAEPEGKKEPTVKRTSAPHAELTLAHVQERWPELLTLLQASNQSLRLICNVAAPIALDGNQLTLGVRFAFHQERLEMPKNKRIIEEALQNLLQVPLMIRATVSDQAPKAVSYEKEANVEILDVSDVTQKTVQKPTEKKSGATDSTWDALIESFGGKAA